MILRLRTNNSNAVVLVPKIRAKLGLLMSLGIGGSLYSVRNLDETDGSDST